MSNYLLTKSKFIRGLQCMKALYLDVYRHHLARVSSQTLQKFQAGRHFERQYKSLFTEGIDVRNLVGKDLSQAPRVTQQLLAEDGVLTLFEASFLYNEVLVLADVVQKHADGSIDVFEVKHTAQTTEVLLNDVSIQYYVIYHTLPTLANIYLVNSVPDEYGKESDGQHRPTETPSAHNFAITSQTEVARQRMHWIATQVEQMKSVLRGFEPAIEIGPHCNQPYECPYYAYCSGSLNVQLELHALDW